MTSLPSGRSGQAMAVALLLLAAALAWFGGVAPVLGWYADRHEHLVEQQALAARMAAIAGMAPALQQEAQHVTGAGTPAMLAGGTDAVAGAALQQAVGDMAAAAGASVASAELLPAQAAGAYRRILLHVTASAPWPKLIALFAAVAQATPRMLVDELSLREPVMLGRDAEHPVEASFTVIAFSAGARPAR